MRKESILRIAVLMLCVSMFMAIFCLNVSAAGSMSVKVDSVTSAPGKTVDVAIKLENNPGNLTVLVVTVSYDTSLEFVKTSNGTVFSTLTAGTNLVFDDAGTSKSGTLATLTFKVKDDAELGNYSVNVTVRECYDADYAGITTSATGGKITVECAHKNTKTVAAKAATCVVKGYTEGVYCNDCETYISGHRETAATGKHTYSTTNVIKAATCTETGKQTKTCSVCKKTVEETIAAKGHTAVTDEGVAATCTEKGLTEGSHCSVCNTVIKAQTEIAALGHNIVTDAAKAPTCTKEGLTEGKSCSRCDLVEKAQESIPALGHTAVKDEAKEPTCTETGLTEGTHCSVCNAVIKAQTEIAATGHAYGDWVVDKEATETETGERSKTCDICEHKVTEEIPVITVGTDTELPVDPDVTTDIPEETTDNGGETTVGGIGTDDVTVGTDGEGAGEGDDDGKVCWICWLIILLLILLILAAIYYIRKKMKENKDEQK